MASDRLEAGVRVAELRMFKLRLFDEHCHIVVSRDHHGQPVTLPGVDLRGVEAQSAFDLAAPLLAMLEAQRAGRRARAVVVDLERRRLVVTFELMDGERTPPALRIGDAAAVGRMLEASQPVVRYLGARAAERLARRQPREREQHKGHQ